MKLDAGGGNLFQDVGETHRSAPFLMDYGLLGEVLA
jgi:hypothetical protein